jgi:hypothetical protein
MAMHNPSETFQNTVAANVDTWFGEEQAAVPRQYDLALQSWF